MLSSNHVTLLAKDSQEISHAIRRPKSQPAAVVGGNVERICSVRPKMVLLQFQGHVRTENGPSQTTRLAHSH